MTSTDWLADPRLFDLLAEGELAIEGRIAGASNSTLRCRIEVPGEDDLLCVYKPAAGERPLWDFPDATLGHRELASYELSAALGWDLVPPTVWREDGPGGEGMCQAWIQTDPQVDQVDIVRRGAAPKGWKRVLDATDEIGSPVELVHADTPDLRRIAVFDAVANNADRKGAHVLVDCSGRVWAIDHGVTFSTESKLRTVVWGWAGEPIDDADLRDLVVLRELLSTEYEPIDQWLDGRESMRLRTRLNRLIQAGTYPVPSGQWPAIPWPVF
jgi:uncharacterized repeat protein (TIGR03843 family)